MDIKSITEKKNNKMSLSNEEICFAVDGFCKGLISEGEMTDFLKSIYNNSMDKNETFYFTKVMQNSGETVNFDFDVVDKHSTGGVGDSTTLIITPILASLGINVAKMSGKSLGFTGGTVDKLAVFKGYESEKNKEEFEKIIKKVGASIISQSQNIAIADKKIYALRDKTGLIDSVPLIASSIMSKKLACGSKTILLDVKYGAGAFMKTKEDAIKLAKAMVQIGVIDNKKIWAVITNMNIPLCLGIGSAMEVYCVLKAFNGENSLLLEVSKYLSAMLIVMVKEISFKKASELVEKVIKDGSAFKKLREIVLAHNGSDKVFDNPEKLIQTKFVTEIYSNKSGFIYNIDALVLAQVALKLKNLVSDERKLFNGIMLSKTVGDYINKGDVIAKIYTDNKIDESICEEIISSFEFSDNKPRKIKLIEKVIKG